MSDERVAPETTGVAVELLATIDLGPEIQGMEAARNPFAEKMLQDLSKEPAQGEGAEFAAMLKTQLEKLTKKYDE